MKEKGIAYSGRGVLKEMVPLWTEAWMLAALTRDAGAREEPSLQNRYKIIPPRVTFQLHLKIPKVTEVIKSYSLQLLKQICLVFLHQSSLQNKNNNDNSIYCWLHLFF